MAKKILILWTVGLLGTIAFSPVMAKDKTENEDCEALSSNKIWLENLNTLSSEIQAKAYDNAAERAEFLSKTCSRSPILNYMQGRIAEGKGDMFNARLFFQKASQYTYEIATTEELAQKIWYARYELEHPERTASAVSNQQEQVAALTTELEASKQQNELLNEQLNVQNEKWKHAMWTGAGIGLGGIAITVTGSVLLAMMDSKEIKTSDIEENNVNFAQVSIKPVYSLSYAMIGVGVSMTIIGAVLTGIYGYRYTHSLNDVTYSFQVSPQFTSFDIQF